MKLFRTIGFAVAALCIMVLMAGAVSAADVPGTAGQQAAGNSNHLPGPGPIPDRGSGNGLQLGLGQGHGQGHGNTGDGNLPNNNPPGQNYGNAGNATQPGQDSRQGHNPAGQWPANPAGQGVNNPPGQWPGNPPGQGHGSAGNSTQPGQGRPITPELFNQLESKGYDVSILKVALQNGDVNASRAWLDSFRENNPGVLDKLEAARPGQHQGNTTENSQRPGNGQEHLILTPEILSQLEQMGYDVSDVRTALQNHDVNATRSWVDAFREDNPGVLASLRPDDSGQGQGNDNNGNGQGNHILAPEYIEHLKQKGYDVKEVTAALRSWLSGFLKSGGEGTASGSS